MTMHEEPDSMSVHEEPDQNDYGNKDREIGNKTIEQDECADE
jgi:hypothetical protein